MELAPETIKAQKIMSKVLNCSEDELIMSDGEVGVPSLGVCGIHCQYQNMVYSLSWYKYKEIKLDYVGCLDRELSATEYWQHLGEIRHKILYESRTNNLQES